MEASVVACGGGEELLGFRLSGVSDVVDSEKLDSEALYERLSRDGAAFVHTHLSWKKYAEQMLALFEKAAHPSP